jgi:hypothetical protein
VFFVEVDGVHFYPALLVDTAFDLRRLRGVCRIVWPAEPMSRLDFLTSPQGSLGDMSPLEAMRTDAGYRKTLEVARAWAAEWSRTMVRVYLGEYVNHDVKLPLVCTGVVEIDPRKNVWVRAGEALQPGGNLRPDGPYPRAKSATVFVLRSTAGGAQDVPEVRLDIVVAKGAAHASVVSNHPPLDLEPVPVNKTDDIVVVLRNILGTVRKR